MSDGGFAEEDVRRAVGIAERHLEEAENALWDASKDVADEDLASELESLTRSVWDLQHRIDDLQRGLEEGRR